MGLGHLRKGSFPRVGGRPRPIGRYLRKVSANGRISFYGDRYVVKDPQAFGKKALCELELWDDTTLIVRVGEKHFEAIKTQ